MRQILHIQGGQCGNQNTRARHRPDGVVRGLVKPVAGVREHLLQLGVVRPLRAAHRAHGPGGRRAHEALLPGLPP
jgi:hypothetical protein